MQSKGWVFSRRIKTGSDLADLISWGSLFQTEAAATTKMWSTVERRVAGMASEESSPTLSCIIFTEDDAAERRCSPVDALEHQCRQFELSAPGRNGAGIKAV